MRKPSIPNKYNLKPKDIEKAILLNPEALKEKPFWRNDVISAYCLSGGCGKDPFGQSLNEYWIGFYDNDAKEHAGEIHLHISAYGGMCFYEITEFYNPEEIEEDIDLQIQEMLLEKINWLIDEGIVEIKGKK